ncbi:toll/interleukin-1 receptor domain-containing protein [Streptomyces olivochromogenes]|uniref:toll/interleukin-1 receptor domain-containing protein n=1 Tax=Streptomyces olivochromogenes TaxID=1963 RepID=UPI003694F240
MFLCYSRQDREDVQRLKEQLADKGFNAWIDLSDILPSAKWREAVADGIRRSDALLFVVSPDSVRSEVCAEEIDLAVQYGKRVIPLLHRPVPREDMSKALTAHHWTEGGDLDKVVSVLGLDLQRAHTHTVLLVQAYEWSVNGRRRSALLRGRNLRNARHWLAGSTADEAPTPTELHREYLARGRAAAHQRRGLAALFTALLTTVSLLVGFSRVEEGHQTHSRKLATRAEDALKDQLALGLLLGREAADERPTVEARRALLTALRTRPRMVRFLDALADVPAEDRVEPSNHLPLAVRPGGRLLAIPVRGGVRLVTLPTGRPAWTVRGLGGTPAFSPDGRWLAVATGTDPGKVELVDVARRRVTERLTVPQSHGRPNPGNDLLPAVSGTAVAFSADSASVALAGNDNTLRIWNLKTRTWGGPLKGHDQTFVSGTGPDTNHVNTVAYSPDGRFLVSGDWKGDVLVRDARTGRLLKRLRVATGEKPLVKDVRTLTFHPRGSYLAAGTGYGALTVWRTKDWVRVVDPVAGDDTGADRNVVDTVAFSPDGGTLVTGGWTKGALLRRVGGSWDVIGERLPRDELSGTSAVFLDRGSSLIWGVRGTGTLAVWDVHGPGPLGQVVRGSPGNAVAVAVGPGSGEPVASGGADGTITTGGLTLRHELKGEPGDVSLRSLALSRDGRTLYSAADDGSVNTWDTSTGHRRAHWSLGTMTTAITFGDHGRLLATAPYGDHYRLVVRTVADRKTLLDVPAGPYNVRNLAFSADGSLLAAGTEGGTVVLVDVAKGRVLGTLRGHQDYVQGLAFSPDGKLLATASDDATLALWDVSARRRLTDWIPGHVGKALSAAFSPDGSLLAVGGERGRVLLVDVGSRRALGPALTSDTAPVPCVGSPCGPVRDLAFSRDGKHLVSVTNAAHEIWGVTPKGDVGKVVDPSSVTLPGATLWSTDLTAWSRAACVRAGRALTGAEAHRFDTGDPLPCSP